MYKKACSTCAPWLTVFLPCLVSYLPLLISCATLVPFHPRWLCPSVAHCVIFWGVFLSWLWSSRQEGPRLQMWAAPAATGTEQHIVLSVLGELRLQSEPVFGHHWTRLSAVTPALSDLHAPSITLFFLHHYELHINFKIVKIFRRAFLLMCVCLFLFVLEG